MRIMVLAATTALLTAGCRAQNRSIVCGVYAAKYRNVTESLSLNRDGNFTQEVIVDHAKSPAMSHGRWHLDPVSGFVILDSGYLEVRDILGRVRPDYSQPLSGLVDIPAETCLGRVYLGTSQFVLYEKQSPGWLSVGAPFCRAIL
jgi:hypothetical protein